MPEKQNGRIEMRPFCYQRHLKLFFGNSLIWTSFNGLVNTIGSRIFFNYNGFFSISIHLEDIRTDFHTGFTTNAFIWIDYNTHS